MLGMQAADLSLQAVRLLSNLLDTLHQRSPALRCKLSINHAAMMCSCRALMRHRAWG